MSVALKKSLRVLRNDRLAEGVYDLCLEAGDISKTAKPGEFVSLFCNDGGRLLPRPISICEIHREAGNIRLVYRVVGKGTEEFSKLKAGDLIDCIGPLGKGFTLERGKALIVGGGIGIPPLLELAKQLDCDMDIVLGFRDDIFLNKDFEKYGKLYISTEDGSVGTKGNVIDAIKEHNLNADIIYACGPTPMLRGIKEYAEANQIRAQLSLEERMACGIGACLACVCKTAQVDHHSHVNNTRICKEGPVFYSDEIVL